MISITLGEMATVLLKRQAVSGGVRRQGETERRQQGRENWGDEGY